MSRALALLAACCLAVLLALPSGAQPLGGGSLTVKLPSTVEAGNTTTKAVPVAVDLALNAGTCLGGGTVTVNLSAARTGGNATVTLQPGTLTFNIGQTDTATGGKTFQGQSTLVVDAGAVERPTPVNVTVNGSIVSGCTASAAPGAGSGSSDAATTVVFAPLAGTTSGEPEEVVPGFELPLLVAAIAAALVAMRRRA
jgi:hypothetical protein